MPSHPLDADASVFEYPPVSASGNNDPVVLFDGTLRACFRMVAGLAEHDRRNLEIETLDGEALYNSVDIAKILKPGVDR